MTSYLFHDEFGGPAGSPPNPALWSATPWPDSTSPDDAMVAYDPANAFVDGRGSLILRVSRGTHGRPYNAARIQTFIDGGWPPRTLLAYLAPPVHIEASIRMAAGRGLWGGFWPMGIDSATPIEIDVTEVRGIAPHDDALHVHNVAEWGGYGTSEFDLTAGFHTYGVDYRPTGITFWLNHVEVGHAPVSCSQQVGIRLSNVVGPPGEWGGQGGPPPDSALPADMKIQYVRAWRLAS